MDLVELTEGSVRDINSSKGFDNVKSQTSKSTKHGHSKTARNSIARAGTLSNTTNFPVTKWFEGPAAEQRSGELELTGCVATMSPHLKRVAAANFSKVSPRAATHRSMISSKKRSFI